MADHQFQPCSSWWTAAAAACWPDAVSLSTTPTPFVSCSTVLGRSLNYCDEMMMTSTTSPSASVCNSSATFQDRPSAPAIPAPPMDHFHAPHDYWSQVPFCLQGLLQEDVMNMDMNPLGNPLDLSSIDQSSFALLHGLDLEQDGGLQSSLIQVPRQQLQFSGEALFWNPTATATATATEHHNLRPPPQPPRHYQSSSSYSSNNLVKTPSTLGKKASMENKKNSSEPAPKRTRIETTSPPLPTTFKVRKEKLGDRITAIQQLVSPFGKTDTASVLHEAIDYIKFLHDQVRVLSSPYLQQQIMNLEKSKGCDVQNQDLRSRGLCLVPISSTFAAANEIPTDFWTPPFMGGALI